MLTAGTAMELKVALERAARETSGDESIAVIVLAGVLVAAAMTGRDVGDLLSQAISRAAQDLGGVDVLVAARPGSWESGHVVALCVES